MAVETLARMSKVDVGDMTPPTKEEMDAWFRLEREAVTGAAFRRAIEKIGATGADADGEDASSGDAAVQMFGSTVDDANASSGDAAVQMFGSAGDDEGEATGGSSKSRRRGMVTRYWPVRESTLLFWRQLEDAHARSGMEMSFVTFLCCAFWAAWGPSIGQPQDSLWQHIYDRDRRQCTCPVCTQRHRLEDHHLIFRAHGGGDEPENNGAACGFCHRPGVHEGRLRVFPPASRMRWLIGMRPLIEVIGRDKRELC